MKHLSRPRLLPLLPLACAALLAAQSANASSHPQEVYLETGLFSSIGGGYAYSFHDLIGVRADFARGNYQRRINLGRFRYDARLKTSQLGAYADWFPFGGTFHLSAGLRSGSLGLDVNARFKQKQQITIGEITVPYGGENESVTSHVKWPAIAPYLGLGWGHSTAQRSGFGFVADFGVSIGSPTVQFSISEPLREKLNTAATTTGRDLNAEIEHERRALAADVGKIKVFPHMYLGLAYRF